MSLCFLRFGFKDAYSCAHATVYFGSMTFKENITFALLCIPLYLKMLLMNNIEVRLGVVIAIRITESAFESL